VLAGPARGEAHAGRTVLEAHAGELERPDQGRLQIDGSLDVRLDEFQSHPRLTVLPVTAAVAAESVRLGRDFPKDPADRIIAATARCHGLRLMTADENIRRWGKLPLT
jgi:PIN domain nuclease of toxin-antitoxin system